MWWNRSGHLICDDPACGHVLLVVGPEDRGRPAAAPPREEPPYEQIGTVMRDDRLRNAVEHVPR